MASTEAHGSGAPARSELFTISAPSRGDLSSEASRLRQAVASRPGIKPLDLAFTLNTAPAGGPHRLAIVASTVEELGRKLDHAIKALGDAAVRRIRERSGIYWFDGRLAPEGKVAFVFPGEGSQYPGMLAGLCMEFPAARACFDRIDRVFSDHERGYLPSQFIFPREAGEEDRLWQMDGAVEAVFTANAAIHAVLTGLGVRPEMIVGHSTGDYSALMASGCVPVSDEESLLRLMLDLNGLYQRLEKEGAIPEALLVAVGSVEPGAARTLVERSGGAIQLAMDNCPHQFVLAGSEESLGPVMEKLRGDGAILEKLPFSRAYHTPGFEPVCRHLMQFYGRLPVRAPEVTTWSAATAAPLPADPDAIRRISVAQWAQPVRFCETIEAMYEAGARIFIEAGPRGNLTNFITDILRKRPHLALPADVRQRRGIDQLLHLLGMLCAHGLPADLAPLYARRSPKAVDLSGKISPARPRKLMTLATGWPEMRLGAEVARRVREALGHQELPVAGAPALGAAPSAPVAAAPSRLPEGAGAGAPGLTGERLDAAMAAHFRTMEKMLAIQQEVMSAALSRRGSGASAAPDRFLAAPAPVEPRVEARMEEPAPAVPAVGEAAPSPAAPLPTLPAAPPAAPGDRGVLMDALVRMVGERTGYPPEMIDVDLDLEADLGIDSIKRVEILGSFQKETGLAGAVDMDRLSACRSLRAIVDAVMEAPDPSGDAPAAGEDRPSGGATRALQAPVAVAELPFIREVTDHVPGERLEARILIDRSDALFMRDHCLGRDISKSDPDLTGLPVVPLTMTMEIMAEAAAALAPGKRVTGMLEVRGHRWVVLAGERLELTARAERTAAGIHVTLFEGGKGPGEAAPVAETTVLVADGYAEPPGAQRPALEGERASKWSSERIYLDGMFHGPAFRGILSMERCAENGATAILRALPADGHFRNGGSPAYVTDPVLLDQPGQVVGLWMAERLQRGYVVFPFRLERLDLFAPPAAAGEAFECRASIALVGESQVRSDLDVIDAEGRLAARLTGWWDRRFDLPRPFARLLLSPEESFVGEPWPSDGGQAFVAGRFRGCEVDSARFPEGFFSDHGGFWAEVLARVALGRTERARWQALALPPSRKLEWLLGRVAAKDAARRLLAEQYQMLLPPAEIEILKHEDGRPYLGGAWTNRVREALRVSLSHADGVAVALVGPGSASGVSGSGGIGVDVERIGRAKEEFTGLAFSDEERRLFGGLSAPEREEWALRCWCAKEAVAKALGTGFMGNPRNLIARRLNTATGSVDVIMSPAMAGSFPHLGEGAIAASTWRERDRVYGASTCERSSE
jgi:malonyl CoA-acyl carrier protein transacylase/phosphopantetheinyl transferase